MDRVFECLNSKRFRGEKMYNSALHQINPIVENTLLEAVDFFRNLQKQDFSGRVSRPPCFDGMILTINGIMYYYRTEKEDNPDIYVLTSKFTQDILENLFGTFRQRGGSNVNPTSRVFRTLFRSQTVNCLIKPLETSNYEHSSTESDLLLSKSNEKDVTAHQHDTDDKGMPLPVSDTSSAGSPTDLTDSGTSSSGKENLENAAINYFAGYLAHYLLKKYKCDECRKKFLAENVFFSDRHDQLTFNKMYSNIIKVTEMQGLKKPSKKLYRIVKNCLIFFDKKIERICCEKNIRVKLRKKLEKRFTNSQFFCKGSCKEHHIFLLDHLIKIKIFKYCKNKSLLSFRKQVTQKLRILQNN